MAGWGPAKIKRPSSLSLFKRSICAGRTAQTWADADPYLISGAYANVVVKPFKRVLP
jgi:uncharacterized protein YciI